MGSFVAYGIGLIVARALTIASNTKKDLNKLQFNLRTLLVAVLAVAALLVIYCMLQTDRKQKLLIDAVYRGDLKSTKDLIAKGADVDFRDGWSGTPLMYADGHL